MATSAEVQLSLTLVQGQDEHPFRSINIPADNYVTVGRSSRDHAKSLVASPHNLWLTGMIVSRSHASFSYERNGSVRRPSSLLTESDLPQNYCLYLDDLGSMHGTYLVDMAGDGEFDIQFPRGVKTIVSNGDVIRFGVQLSKSASSVSSPLLEGAANNPDVSLRPPAFRCEMKHIESVDMTSPGGKSFSVPEGSMVEYDIDADDSLYNVDASRLSEEPSLVQSPSRVEYNFDEEPVAEDGVVDADVDEDDVIDYSSEAPSDDGEDKSRINILCAAAESFVPESIPSNTENLWTQFVPSSHKRTFDEAQLDGPESAEEASWKPDETSFLTEEAVLATVEVPNLPLEPEQAPAEQHAGSVDQLAIKNLVTATEEQPAAAVEQPLQEAQAAAGAESKPEPEQAKRVVEAAATSEPPRKRSKLGVAWGAACFLAGSVGTVAALATLPDGFFAS